MLFSSTQNYVKHRAMQKTKKQKQNKAKQNIKQTNQKNQKTKLNILKNKTNIPLHLV